MVAVEPMNLLEGALARLVAALAQVAAAAAAAACVRACAGHPHSGPFPWLAGWLASMPRPAFQPMPRRQRVRQADRLRRPSRTHVTFFQPLAPMAAFEKDREASTQRNRADLRSIQMSNTAALATLPLWLGLCTLPPRRPQHQVWHIDSRGSTPVRIPRAILSRERLSPAADRGEVTSQTIFRQRRVGLARKRYGPSIERARLLSSPATRAPPRQRPLSTGSLLHGRLPRMFRQALS
ncbi:uncharacterized protein PSFLO_00082 [Pseudozyma flocculosa]|uniref:Uncharacterized protein n=1 Tax=Pseudozyma flocculosa TaxID=84751 RepID=A0A5C3EUC1_9BASI|nr:uncharacterized protein PSFLO_00082 [Pseudozyma flocculosa]